MQLLAVYGQPDRDRGRHEHPNFFFSRTRPSSVCRLFPPTQQHRILQHCYEHRFGLWGGFFVGERLLGRLLTTDQRHGEVAQPDSGKLSLELFDK